MASNQTPTTASLTAELDRINTTIDEIMASKAALASSKAKMKIRAQESMARLEEIQNLIEECEAEIVRAGDDEGKREEAEAKLEELDKEFLEATEEVRVVRNVLREYAVQGEELDGALRGASREGGVVLGEIERFLGLEGWDGDRDGGEDE